MNISYQLYQLQKIDSQIDSAKRRLEQIRVEMENDDSIMIAQSEMKQLKDRLLIEKKALTIVEDEVLQKKVKIEESESSLYSGTVNNPKELQDLQIEISLLKKQVHEMEEQELQKMIAVEEIEKQIAQTKLNFDSLETKFNTSKSLLISEKGIIETSIHRIQQERSAIYSQISPLLIEQYEKLRAVKQGVAIVTLQENSCSVCGTTLTPSQHQIANSPNELFYCPTCQRIIYAA